MHHSQGDVAQTQEERSSGLATGNHVPRTARKMVVTAPWELRAKCKCPKSTEPDAVGNCASVYLQPGRPRTSQGLEQSLRRTDGSPKEDPAEEAAGKRGPLSPGA